MLRFNEFMQGRTPELLNDKATLVAVLLDADFPANAEFRFYVWEDEPTTEVLVEVPGNKNVLRQAHAKLKC
ncbi:hypothetical protein [Bradyrhizobium sp. JYMT SZCCT0180]|uniref:hypothetical protein n=1 Tax=Bradyrhizobium sp. JYMT SZCCT0180 TaxID=2807666 RepID=UPI001BA55C8C|nr:hypothetical protein [Bradyrhizobium sp. JYMT SZCCT0180]MBR1216203.1 hypothetical protein [Bradyrhizobium sp. JYMT SZCCT0180]